VLLSTDDLDKVVEDAAAARLDNTGQSCNAAKRFIVVDSLYDAFLEKFQAALAAVQPSDPSTEESKLGPLSSAAAADRLQDQLDRAVAQGAQLHSTGARSGNYFAPAILTGISPDNDAYHEEFFGPVASVYKVSSEDEAIALANDIPFGLGSYVYTTDAAQAARVADRIEAGMVFVNLVLADGVELPFGGVKRSGTGREMGRLGADEFVNKKLIRIAG
jgi:succinate-semialdehyde dehydrogenase/glutarate-semialdehyde dehydrogenase